MSFNCFELRVHAVILDVSQAYVVLNDVNSVNCSYQDVKITIFILS